MSESPVEPDGRALAAASMDGVGVVEDGVIVFANERLAETFGYETERMLVDRQWHDLITPADEDTTASELLARAREAGNWQGSGVGQGRNGDRFPVQLSLQATDAGVACIVRKVTDPRRRAPEGERSEFIPDAGDDGDEMLDELRAARRFNEELVEYAPFSIVRIDEDFLITYINPRTEEVTGLPEDMESQAMDVDIRELPSVAETGEAHLFTPLKDGETIEFEFPFESLYGREVYFTGRGVPLMRDGEFEGAVLMAVDISERRQQEKDLERQRDELDTLNQINELLLEVARDLFESPRQGDIERTVCNRLVDSDLYQAAWVGKPEVGGTRLVPDAIAGIPDDHLEPIAVTTDEDGADQDPVGEAFRTGTVQVSQDVQSDPTVGAWREAFSARNVRSVAAVPLAYDGTIYGVLAVFSSRPLAFSQREQRGFEVLGEATGYAINASRTRQLLFAEQVTELEFRFTDASEFVVDASDRLGCSLGLEGYISTDDEPWLMYFSLLNGDVDRFVDVARADPAVETVRTVGNGSEPVVAMTARSSLLDEIAALGGRVTSGSVEAGHGTVVVEVPQSMAVGEFVEQIRSIYPGVELLAKRDGERPADRYTWLSDNGAIDLTERQRQALEAAYLAGYFDWPRASTAEDVADLLDISRPTLQAHLRKAEHELLGVFLEDTEPVGQDADP